MLQGRIMGRAQAGGRADDNDETVATRLATFATQSLPVGLPRLNLQDFRSQQRHRAGQSSI